MDLCTPADVYSFGLPRGAAPNPGRLAGVDASSDTFTLDGHGFAAGDALKIRPEANGLMPQPLVQGLTYYALPIDELLFQVAATDGGAAIDLITAGARVVVVGPSPVAAAISFVSRIIEDMLPAHVVPLTDPVPDIIRMTAAEMAAAKVMAMSGTAAASIGVLTDQARKRLERWATGVPLRDANATPAANLATAASAPLRDSRGWSRFGGL